VKTFVNFVVEFYHEEHKEYTKGTKAKTPVIGEAEYKTAACPFCQCINFAINTKDFALYNHQSNILIIVGVPATL
jgi:hypothetical protein